MSSVSTRWSIIDSATAVHRVECQSLAQDADDGPADAALNGLDDQVVGYGLEARRAYDELKRTIGQVAGLLILAQAGGRRDAFDLPALRRAEAVQEEALDRVRRWRRPRASPRTASGCCRPRNWPDGAAGARRRRHRRGGDRPYTGLERPDPRLRGPAIHLRKRVRHDDGGFPPRLLHLRRHEAIRRKRR